VTSTALTVRPPLTPEDCDLRDFGHMPLDVRKFRDSDLVALEEPEAIVAAIMLWGAAWHQLPAASLPDDDRVLANLAGYGRAVPSWRKVKEGALRGFVKCSDGRLYHPLIADKALTAWDGKLRQRWRTYCSAIRMHNSRNPEDERHAPTYDDWEDQGRPTTVTRLTGKKPREPDLFEDDESRATGDDVTRNVTRNNEECSPDVARISVPKGKGERKGKGKGDSNITSIVSEADDLLAKTARIAAVGGVSLIQPSKLARAIDVVKAWVADDIPLELILETVAKRVDDMPESEVVSSLAYFDSPIRKAFSKSGRRSSTPTATPPTIRTKDDNDPRVSQIRERLKSALGLPTYEGWLSPKVSALSLNGSAITVTLPSRFMADWSRSHFLNPIRDASGIADVRFEVENL
jgi:hypothetical protein